MKRLFVYGFLAFYPLCGWGQTVHLQLPARDTSRVGWTTARPFAPGGGLSLTRIPADFHTKSFGFFCRQELKMYKANVPVSFRLGSMEYCNMLEQKGKR